VLIFFVFSPPPLSLSAFSLQGLIWTAGAMYRALHALNIPVPVQEVCVLTAPLFSAFCALSTFAFVREVRGRGAGLAAAALVSVVPSYVSRSVAGSFDNEGVAIFALVTVFFFYIKTLNTGSLAWAAGLCGAYAYMVASWGGYTFIINLLPIHALALIVSGRASAKLYIAFAPLVVIGTLEAAAFPVVGFNAILMSEHFGAFLAFAVLHAALAAKALKALLPPRAFASAIRLLLTAGSVGAVAVIASLAAYVAASPTFGWTGRSLSLLDPTYAAKYIPIIASVSEHQPPTWSSYFTDLHAAVLLAPAGLIACVLRSTDASLFLALYGVTAVYFSGVMVRLMLVLAPAACCLAGIAFSDAAGVLGGSLRAAFTSGSATPDVELDGAGEAALAAAPAGAPRPTSSGTTPPAPRARGGGRGGAPASASSASPLAALRAFAARPRRALPADVAGAGVFLLGSILVAFLFHSIYVASEMYSSPSIVMQTRTADGGLHIFDDFREAYAWLAHNTPDDAKVASWWDYGYQTTAMANRTVIVDNNTWNNTHIATVGRAMALPEKQAWAVFKSLDVDYVFVVFGGFVGYPSDDINKFLWMVRIGGGEFGDIKESDFVGDKGYKVDKDATPAMLASTMYRLSYYRFAQATARGPDGAGGGMDRVRGTEIGLKDFSLRYFEEVFTSQHWMMRVYKVKDAPEREARLPNARRRAGVSKA